MQNSDVVVAQLDPSTLWDGISPGLISMAGGFVYQLGTTEPVPPEDVLSWFDVFGYESRARDGARLLARCPVPPFVAGMDPDRVAHVAEAAKRTGLPGQ